MGRPTRSVLPQQDVQKVFPVPSLPTFPAHAPSPSPTSWVSPPLGSLPPLGPLLWGTSTFLKTSNSLVICAAALSRQLSSVASRPPVSPGSCLPRRVLSARGWPPAGAPFCLSLRLPPSGLPAGSSGRPVRPPVPPGHPVSLIPALVSHPGPVRNRSATLRGQTCLPTGQDPCGLLTTVPPALSNAWHTGALE